MNKTNSYLALALSLGAPMAMALWPQVQSALQHALGAYWWGPLVIQAAVGIYNHYVTPVNK